MIYTSKRIRSLLTCKSPWVYGQCKQSQDVSRIFFYLWVDPSRNRLTSTAYFAIVSSLFCMQNNAYMICIHQNQIKIFSSQIWSNLHERCGIERKIKFQIFPIYSFSSYGHFCTKNYPNFQ